MSEYGDLGPYRLGGTESSVNFKDCSGFQVDTFPASPVGVPEVFVPVHRKLPLRPSYPST